MEESKSVPVALTETRSIDAYKHDPDHIEEVVIARLTEEEIFKLSEEAFSWRSKAALRMAGIMFVQGCNQAGYGVDWGVISGINSYQSWHTYLNFTNDSTTYATLNALMSIGNICGAPFQTFADVIGRRGINWIGNFIVIFAAILQGCAQNMPMFMAGRFFLGFGSAIMSSPQYMAEVAPAHLRGRLVGIFGSCFQVGSVLMLAAMVGFTDLSNNNNWQWRVPLLLEAMFPLIVCVFIYILTPESPRFLVMNGKISKARQVIAKHHTVSEDENSPLVDAVIRQIEDSLESDRILNRQWWNWTVFFTKAARYRFLILVLYACFQQWNGGGIISFYLSPMLDQIGITKARDQLGWNLGLTLVYWLFTLIGSTFVDKFRRRTLILWALIIFAVLQTAATLTSWAYNTKGHPLSAVGLTITWVFLFQMFSASMIAIMHNLYPVEVLALPLRAKGLGLFSLLQGICGVIQTYGIQVGISDIGYKIFAVYVGYNLCQFVASYFIFPETYGLTLEEIDAVFETPGVRPVKMSLDIQKAKNEKQRLEDQANGIPEKTGIRKFWKYL